MTDEGARRAAVASAIAGSMLIGIVALNSLSWIGTTFPGFFLMANRVVPSVSLPTWSAGEPSRFFQHQVLEVNGRAVQSASQAYGLVRELEPGTEVRYRMRAARGASIDGSVPARRFSGFDHVALFGAFLLNGIAFLATGLFVFFLKPRHEASLGLLAASLTISLFVITAVDLYGPAWLFRLHVAAEALMGAGLLHLALVFPTNRIRIHRRAKLAAVYLPFAALALLYEILLYSPSGYTAVHLAATIGQVVGAVALIATVGWDLVVTRSPLLRRRVAIVGLGTFFGFFVPAILWAASAAVRGSIPVNAAAFTAFVFPLSLGYAIVKRDLFEIDVLLRRAGTYVVVLLAVGTIYLSVLLGAGALVPSFGTTPGSRVAIALLNLAVLLLLTPVRARVQSTLDRVFFRTGYDAEPVLADLSRRLAAARNVQEVAETTLGRLRTAFWPRDDAFLLATPDGRFRTVAGSLAIATVALPAALRARCERGEIVTRYEFDDGSGQPIPELWEALGADLLVPIRHHEGDAALLILGPRRSGKAYTMFDATFLYTVANQVGLALTSAAAFEQLASLNARLEEQVRERTAALESVNEELAASVDDVREAYARLERSQASLMRADRLATLGRLVAGMAHEVNTPLGAVMNSLKLIEDLGVEYSESIDDPTVEPEDHREIATEILSAARSAHGWAERGARFISKMKLHGSGARETPAAPVLEAFSLDAVVRDVHTLLAHRMRALCVAVEYEEDPVGARAVGDRSRFSQILVNLLQNAIDAYEERSATEARIAIAAREVGDDVVITVRDWAGGIRADVLPRIFEELFTTKEPGRGTGLGLWIARNIVESSFGGSLTVDSEIGVGTCFTARLRRPPARLDIPATAPPRLEAGSRG